MKLYLASKSPRRRALLAQMGVEVELLLLDVPEQTRPDESPEAYSLRITCEKLQASVARLQHEQLPILPVLCADTEVVVDQHIAGKPRDYDHAFAMLKQYSGRSHQVITSVGIQYHDYQKTVTHISTVTFATMPDEAIHHYLAMGDYKDKAGAYGIQSYIGQFISNIDGCFYSVMGLPLNVVRELLLDLDSYNYGEPVTKS